jgi:hypothetical protein
MELAPKNIGCKPSGMINIVPEGNSCLAPFCFPFTKANTSLESKEQQ